MRRRSLLTAIAGGTAVFAGCGALTSPFRSESRTTNEDADERPLEHPTGEPVASERLGESTDGDPHVVTVGVVDETRDLEIHVLAGNPGETVHAERYALADGDHVRFELHDPDEYAVDLREDDEAIGDPYEIEADWFEYDCPATVIELGAGERFSASTEPDTGACE